MNGRKITSKMISLMSRQSLKASRMRNVFVTLAVALASALLTAILMFAAGQNQQFKNELSHRQQVSYYNLTEAQADALGRDERIACQVRVKSGILSEMDGIHVMPYYVSELSRQIQIAELADGRLPQGENELAAQAPFLEKMGVAPEVGSTVTLAFYDGNTEQFAVSGILKGGEEAKQFAVFLSEDYARNGSQLKDQPYEVYAKLYGAAVMNPDDCREAMYLIGSDAGIQRKYVHPSRAFIESLSVDSQDIMVYGLIGMVILLACILVIYGVFYLSVIGRIHQFGQLRAIGMTRKQLKRLVAREGGVLYLRSAPTGILIGGIAGYFMIPGGFHPVNTLLIAGLVFIAVYLITMISVRKPARLAAAVSPMEALRYVPQDENRARKNPSLRAGRMRKPGGMTPLHGPAQEKTAEPMCRSLSPLSLGVMNFSRNKRKAVITFASLGLGGILFMAAATYISSFDKENFARQGVWKDAEFQLLYSPSAVELSENGMSGLQAACPLDNGLIQRIQAIDGVRRVTEIKNFGVQFDYPKNDEFGTNDAIYPLTGEETREIGRYLAEGSADFEKLASGGYVLVADNSTVAEIYGWKFETGDKITLHYFDGSKTAEREVTILGILNEAFVLEHNRLDGWFLMPEQAILSWLSCDSLNAALLISTEADREAAVGEALAEIAQERPELVLEALADRRIAYEQNANNIFGAISGLAAFIMTFSILSMMNTLITNIVTRKQELAMLESIGMGKGQIRKMLLGESLLLAIATVGITMTAGTLCGYGLCNALYSAGAFYMAFRFPAAFSLAYAAVLTAVPLIIIYAAMKNFSREALVERLRGVEG